MHYNNYDALHALPPPLPLPYLSYISSRAQLQQGALHLS